MTGIMRNSIVLVQRIVLVSLIGSAATLGIAGVGTENPAERATIPPQGLLRQVTVYELRLDDLPNDMTVTIVKKGSNPPELHVEQGRWRYDAPEGNLAALPAKVRQHVERMFGVSR
jgi:hypothetical protein